MTVKNALRFAVLLVLALVVVGAYAIFTAKAGSDVASSVAKLAPTRIATPKEVLQFQRSLSNNPQTPIAQGVDTLVDQETISCPGPGTCLYMADEWVQVGTGAATTWAVFSTLDGNFMTGGGPYQYANAGELTTASWSESAVRHVNPGNHTIQTFVVLNETPGTMYDYNFNYRVFKP